MARVSKYAVKHKNLYQLFLANSDYINNLERNKKTIFTLSYYSYVKAIEIFTN